MNDQTRSSADPDSLVVVGIGASAGGLAALTRLFENLRTDTGMAFVVVQHLAPTKKSELDAILQRYTEMPAEVITESVRLEANHIYVIPPNHSLTLEEETLHLVEPPADRHEHLSIDRFFESLARAKKEHAVGVILSGSRSDGARGIIAIREHGGLTLAQSPDDAKFVSMPQAAIDTKCIDLVLPADEIAARLVSYAVGNDELFDVESDRDEEDFESSYRKIISRVHVATGRDFANYKRSTILRRISRRVRVHELPDLQSYLNLLDESSDEIQILFNEFLLTVTDFFRDPDAFQVLQDKVIPRLYIDRTDDETIRVWVPGCATGEEVYSLAILLWEEAESRGVFPDFKIFATDLSSRVIEHARKGIYPLSSLSGLSSQRQERFFVSDSGGLRVVSEIRDRILFAVHDVLHDPPFARQKLISCRNLLIYLDPEAQQRVFEILHYALSSKCYLFLGNSEFLGGAKDLFKPIDKTHRIYSQKPVPRRIRPQSGITNATRRPQGGRIKNLEAQEQQTFRVKNLHHRLLSQQYAPPGVVVDEEFRILHVSGDVDGLLRIPSGQPTFELLRTVHPEFRLPLRTALVDAFEGQKSTRTGTITVEGHGQLRSVQLFVRPLPDRKRSDAPMAQVIFEPIEEPPVWVPKLAADLTEADTSVRRAVEQLEKENENLKEKLYETIDCYETTTEELKTSNEELMTINEELQSTTEELETSKEELQSTNEELITVNDELSHKIGQLDEAKSDLENLLSSTEIGTVFLSSQLEIRRFTEPIRQYFNLRETDLGRPLAHVTHLLDYDELVDDARKVHDNLEPVEREVWSKDRRWFIARIFPYRTASRRVDGVVVTFLILRIESIPRNDWRKASCFFALFLSVPQMDFTSLSSMTTVSPQPFQQSMPVPVPGSDTLRPNF